MSDDLRKFNLNKNIPFAVMAFTINVGLVFLSYRLVIAKNGIEAVGLWSTLFAWTALIRIGDVGMTGAALRFVALCDIEKDVSKLKRYVETGLLSNTAMFLLLGTLGYLILSLNLTNIVEEQYISEAKIVLPLMMISFVLMNISGTLLGILQGLHFGYINSQLAVAGNLLQIIVVVALVPYLGLAGLAWAQIVQYSFSILLGWYLVRRKSRIQSILPFCFSKTVFREMLGFSLKAQLANILNGLFEPISKILVGQLGGMHTLGIYELAYKTLWLPRSAVIGGVTAMVPSLTSLFNDSPEKVKPLYNKSTKFSTWAVVAVSLVLILVSPLISWLWLGEIDWTYSTFIAALTIGIVFNAWGASAYNLAIVTGVFRNNIIVNAAILLGLCLAAYVLSSIFSDATYLILGVSLCMAVGGITIRILNERLLTAQCELKNLPSS